MSQLPKVLLLDCSKTAQKILARYLDQLAEISAVGTLAEATTRLQLTRFDLLISDYVFPEGNSFDLLLKLRRQFTPDQLPIIVVSSDLDMDLISQLSDISINASMSKPLEAHKFVDLVRHVLETKEVLPPAVHTNTVPLMVWSDPQRSYAFCPNFNHTVIAETEDLAVKQLKDWIGEQTIIPPIGNIKQTPYHYHAHGNKEPG
jgi:DNA-binding NarL/FixJ family response regulator